MQQALLPIQLEDISYEKCDFIVSYCNLEAYRAITTDIPWPSNRLLLIGEYGSGKTHLARIWEQRIGSQAMILENIEDYTDQEIITVINTAQEQKWPLFMTMGQYRTFQLPDLKSRLNATYTVFIKNPDEEMIMILVAKRLHDKQIKFSQDVLEYISMRLERSFKDIALFIQYIDNLSLIAKREINIHFIRNALKHLEIYREDQCETMI